MQHRIIALAACALFGLSCASTDNAGPPAAAPPSADTAGVRLRQGLLVSIVPGHTVTAEVTDENDLLGSTVSLHREPGGESGDPREVELQGSVFDRPVSITIRADEATGIVNALPVNLHLVSDAPPGVTRVRGLIAGQMSDFEFGANHLSGNVGRCGYELRGNEQHFEGYRSCGRGRGAVRVEIGTRIAPWTPMEKASVLALTLRG